MAVTVRVKNPPYKANYWSLVLFNTVWGDSVRLGLHVPIDQPQTLESLPAGWSFPLYMDIMMNELNVKPYNVVHQVQSAYGSDWRYYLDITIPGHGSYYYNVATGKIELIEPPAVVPCEITIDAPESAQEGEKVSVSALLRNISTISIMYKIEIHAVPDLFPAFRIGTIEKNINSGATFTAYGSFTMPASNTTILIWVERWAADHWVYDNSASKAISLGVVPEYKGTISKRELEYDETKSNIPVY